MANTSLCTADLHLQCFRAALVRSGNERIKSMWLEAKQQWCNKMLGSIWWSEDGLGKESYSPCSACQACCYLWFPYFCFFPLSQVLSTEFSLWLWNIPKIEGWGIHLDALLWLKLCLLLPVGAHNMTLTQQDLIPVSQDGLLILKEIKSDFRALVPTAAMMFPSCILSFWFFMGKSVPAVAYIGEVSNTLCHLISVMTEVTALHLTQLSNSVNCTAGRTQNSQRSPENFPTKPHVSEENPFILF